MADADNTGLTLASAQSEVDDWINTTGVKYFSPLTNLGILTEEVGELARLMVRHFGEQSFKPASEPPDMEAALRDEIADVFWVILCLSNQMGINLTTAFLKNMEKKTTRDAGRHKSNPKL